MVFVKVSIIDLLISINNIIKIINIYKEIMGLYYLLD